MHFDSADGRLLLTTGVTGPAAKMGHALTIAMTSWRATVEWDADRPVAAEFTVHADSLQVQAGHGGVKGLSGPEKALARSHALKVLDAKKYPTITFRADDIDAIEGGYRLDGTLEIHGTSRAHAVDVRVEDLGDSWQVGVDAEVLHSEFGLKPYALMLGAMKVTDPVAVSLRAQRPKG